MKSFLRRHWLIIAVVAVCCYVAAFVVLVETSEPRRHAYPDRNYSLIDDRLYLGGILAAPPPGANAVLNVCEDKDPYTVEVHRWQPIADAAPAPSLEWLRSQVEFIEEQRKAGRTLFVHCHGGVSRSALVMTAYLMKRDGLKRDEALTKLRAKRSRVRPNPAFMELLLEWEKTLK